MLYGSVVVGVWQEAWPLEGKDCHNKETLGCTTMKLKELESLLTDVQPFTAPKFQLEQYNTSAHLAARVLFAAYQDGNVEDKVVADFGCGTGMFTIGSQILGAK